MRLRQCVCLSVGGSGGLLQMRCATCHTALFSLGGVQLRGAHALALYSIYLYESTCFNNFRTQGGRGYAACMELSIYTWTAWDNLKIGSLHTSIRSNLSLSGCLLAGQRLHTNVCFYSKPYIQTDLSTYPTHIHSSYLYV